jgi:hypothetical protein
MVFLWNNITFTWYIYIYRGREGGEKGREGKEKRGERSVYGRI